MAVGPAKDYVAGLGYNNSKLLKSQSVGTVSFLGVRRRRWEEEAATGLTPCGGFQYCVWA